MTKPTVMVLSCHTHSLFWFRIDMMREFIKCGYRVVAAGQEEEELWKPRFAELGIEYRKITAERNGTNPIKDLKTLRCIKRLIEEEKPEKIFTYQAKTVIYGSLAARLAKVTEIYPLIAGLGSVFRGEGAKNRILRSVMTFEYRIALKHAKKVFFQNGDDLGCFVDKKILPYEKAVMINGSGVDTERFIQTPLPDTPAFLMTARLIKDKGIFEYLNAAKAVKAEHPHVRFMLVGPYDTNPSSVKPGELDEYISSGCIEYFGEQTDVRPFLDSASVFVLPSYHEGTPKTVLEAMAAGRAVITTDAPGCRETVTDGINGLLVPVGNTVAVAEAMKKLISSPSLCQSMGDEGRRLAKEKYDIRKVNADILDTMGIRKYEKSL